MNKVLITGGTGLLGRVFVKGFLDKGWDVYFTSTNSKNIEKLTQEFNNTKNLIGIIAKLDNDKGVEEFLSKLTGIKISCLINNARSLNSLKVNEQGHSTPNSLMNEFFMSSIAPYMIVNRLETTLKTVVNIASMYGVVAPNKNLYVNGYDSSPIQYGIGKAAQIHLTKELAVRLADKSIRVNAVSFGGFEGRTDEAFLKKYNSHCPMGRMLKNDEAFGHVYYLASELSTGMTGHNVVVDGGWSVW
jgi:NAD(P)-dependent dehydrogenase (short-subunit alcohol dehydrogenase family)